MSHPRNGLLKSRWEVRFTLPPVKERICLHLTSVLPLPFRLYLLIYSSGFLLLQTSPINSFLLWSVFIFKSTNCMLQKWTFLSFSLLGNSSSLNSFFPSYYKQKVQGRLGGYIKAETIIVDCILYQSHHMVVQHIPPNYAVLNTVGL